MDLQIPAPEPPKKKAGPSRKNKHPPCLAQLLPCRRDKKGHHCRGAQDAQDQQTPRHFAQDQNRQPKEQYRTRQERIPGKDQNQCGDKKQGGLQTLGIAKQVGEKAYRGAQGAQQAERQQSAEADRPERKPSFPGQMDDDTGGRKQDGSFAQGYGRLRERPHGLEQGLQDGDYGGIEQHRIMAGQDGAPGPEAVFLHQMLDEAPPEVFVPIDEPGPGIMPGEQEQ